MKYQDLFDMWLEGKRQETPSGFKEVKNIRGAPKNYFLAPEDMNALLNAFSPFDLYRKPDNMPAGLDYETSAFNIRNLPNGVGVENAIVQASRSPSRRWLPIRSTAETAEDYSPEEKPYAPQGIYEHEVAHFFDPRLNPAANNYGFTTRFGLPGNIGGREAPAMEAENRFFRNLRKSKKK